MKSRLFLFAMIFTAFLVACSQTQKANEKESETQAEKTEELSEPITVKGKIVDSKTGDAVGMAILIVKGTTIGTMSDMGGNFLIYAPAGAKKLVFSADGFETLEIDMDGEKEMEVKLTPKSEEIVQ